MLGNKTQQDEEQSNCDHHGTNEKSYKVIGVVSKFAKLVAVELRLHW